MKSRDQTGYMIVSFKILKVLEYSDFEFFTKKKKQSYRVTHFNNKNTILKKAMSHRIHLCHKTP
jgi:hypothetical protein